MSKREIRPGENVADSRERWRKEKLHETFLQREREMSKERKIAREKRRARREREKLRHELRLEMKARKLHQEKPKIMVPPKPIIMPPPIPYVPGDKKLSILICSIGGRERLLQNLEGRLKKQSRKNINDVEILVEIDNKKITTGAKRNILLKRARGNYICFVDDDDRISDDYVVKILEAIKSKPDCCSLQGLLRRKMSEKKLQRMRRMKGKKWIKNNRIRVNIFIHSLQYETWFEKNNIYYRCPNHLNAVRRELALQVGFPDLNKGEDKAYSLKLFPLLKTESVIKGTIYFYENI